MNLVLLAVVLLVVLVGMWWTRGHRLCGCVRSLSVCLSVCLSVYRPVSQGSQERVGCLCSCLA